MFESTLFAFFAFSVAVAQSLPLDGTNAMADEAAANRVKKDVEKVASSDVQSSKNKTMAEPKSAAPNIYSPAGYGQFMPPFLYQSPAAFPYYTPFSAPTTYPAHIAPGAPYQVSSPYAPPFAAAPQPVVVPQYSPYYYRDQQQSKEMKSPAAAATPAVEGKTLHRLLRPSVGYAPSYYQAQPQPQYYSTPVSGYQYHESFPAAVQAVQPFVYAVPEYGSYSYYNNGYRSQNMDKTPALASGQYAPTGRDVASNDDDVYASYAPLSYNGGFGQIEDLRQRDQQIRPSHKFESMPSRRVIQLSRIADEPALDDYQRWGYNAAAAPSGVNSPIPAPAAEDQVYVVMNPYEANQNVQSKTSDFYAHPQMNVDGLAGWSAARPAAPIAAVNAVPAAFVKTAPSLPPYAHPNIFAQMGAFYEAVHRQNLASENKRMPGVKMSNDEQQLDTNRLYQEVMKMFKPEPKSNEAKEMTKETTYKDEAKKSDDKSEKKQ